jgi:choline kinase
MDAAIIAAGRGSRYEDLPEDSNKCILKIDDKPILSYSIDALRKYGINNICVVTGHNAEEVKKALGDGVSYVYNPFYEFSSLLVSIAMLRDLFYGREFLLLDGDLIYDPRILEKLLNRDKEALLTVEMRECDEEDFKFLIEGDFIVKTWKYIKDGSLKDASGEYGGITKFAKESSKGFFDSVLEVLKEKNFAGLHADALNKMIEKKHSLFPVATNPYMRTEIDFRVDFERAKEIIAKLKREGLV